MCFHESINTIWREREGEREGLTGSWWTGSPFGPFGSALKICKLSITSMRLYRHCPLPLALFPPRYLFTSFSVVSPSFPNHTWHMNVQNLEQCAYQERETLRSTVWNWTYTKILRLWHKSGICEVFSKKCFSDS